MSRCRSLALQLLAALVKLCEALFASLAKLKDCDVSKEASAVLVEH
jgi:hypothetical protein